MLNYPQEVGFVLSARPRFKFLLSLLSQLNLLWKKLPSANMLIQACKPYKRPHPIQPMHQSLSLCKLMPL